MTISSTVDDHLLDESGIDLFALLCHRRGWTADYLAAIEVTDHD